MGKDDQVTEEQCEDRISKVHTRIGTIDRAVAKIMGGVIVVSALISLFVGFVSYHVDYRFTNLEDSLEEINNNIKEFHKTK